MKYFTIVLFTTIFGRANAECTSDLQVYKQPTVHNVNTDVPEFLQGGTITVTLASGKSSTVPAEEYMVVPRRQQLVVGQNVTLLKRLTCKNDNKNLVAGELRKDYTNLDIVKQGNTATVYSNKRPIPGINYYRRDIVDTLGAGVGVDSNGTLKALIGIDF